MKTAYYYGQAIDDPNDQSVICIVTDDKGRQYVGQYIRNAKGVREHMASDEWAKTMAGKAAGLAMERSRKAA